MDGYQYDEMIEVIRGKAAEIYQQALDTPDESSAALYKEAACLNEAAKILERDAG